MFLTKSVTAMRPLLMPSSHVTPNGVSTPGVPCGALSPAMSMPSALSAPESTMIPF